MQIDIEFDINAIDEKRFAFLTLLYKKTLGYVYESTPEKELGDSLGLGEAETDRISVYLRDEGLLKWAGGGEVSITHAGLKLVENSIRKPQLVAEHICHTDEKERYNLKPDERKQKRFEFLYRLYQLSEGDIGFGVDTIELGASVGVTADESRRMASNLHDQGLVWGPMTLSNVAITEAGVNAVEDALAHPSQATHFFPPVQYIINARDINNSPIQQGSNGSTQTTTFAQSDLQPIKAFVADIRTKINALDLAQDVQAELDADVSTLETQLASPKPKAAVLTTCLHGVKTVLEQTTANVAAAALLHQLHGLHIPGFWCEKRQCAAAAQAVSECARGLPQR